MNNRFTLAVLPRTQRGSPLVLAASPDGANFLYCHGHSVVIRSLDSPQCADVYTQHSCDVNVAKYSPSGFYIASADQSGKVRIWDTVNKEHILKNEFQPISGSIKDLAWSPDNQRIVVVGEGREKFGHVFLADTGTSNGDITGQSRPVNSCDFRPGRPFRIITGSEDNTSAVYEGPPFKFKCTKTEHSRYCQVVRYSPNGEFWASGGFDGKLFLYDGKDSNLLDEIKSDESAHSGGIYGLCFSPDSKQILTASGDKTCKIWDVETRKVVTEFSLGQDVTDQQLGCLWSPANHLLSVSLKGNINFLDARSPSAASRVIQGHNKPLTAMAKGDGPKLLYTGDSEGRVNEWNTETGVAVEVGGGTGPSNQVNALHVAPDGRLNVASIDDCLRLAKGGAFDEQTCLKLNAQPRAVSVCGSKTFVATVGSVVVIENGEVVSEKAVSYEPSCISTCQELGHVAVGEGGNNQHNVHVYDMATLDEVKEIKLSGQVTDVEYAPNAKYMVTADSNRKVTLFAAPTYEKAHTKEWGFHTAKVTCLAWSPDSQMVASGGLDCAIILWSLENPQKHFILSSAHVQSQITGLRWMDSVTLASTGQDGNLKIWNVNWKL